MPQDTVKKKAAAKKAAKKAVKVKHIRTQHKPKRG